MHPTCTEVIRKVVSPVSRLATVDLSVRGIIQSMALPVGTYHFNRTLLSDGVCETIIRIFGESFILGCRHSICIYRWFAGFVLGLCLCRNGQEYL